MCSTLAVWPSLSMTWLLSRLCYNCSSLAWLVNPHTTDTDGSSSLIQHWIIQFPQALNNDARCSLISKILKIETWKYIHHSIHRLPGWLAFKDLKCHLTFQADIYAAQHEGWVVSSSQFTGLKCYGYCRTDLFKAFELYDHDVRQRR